MRHVIYVFGNPLLKEDSLPLKLLPRLRKEFPDIDFVELDPSDNIHELGKELIILDTVQGIRKVEIIENTDSIETGKAYSLHDFDLGQNLKLMKKLELIERIRIIGIPMGMNKNEAIEQVRIILQNLFSK
ncbi:MAG: hypothetical protein HYX24_02360 [Candidatus Aenigmarchaeota archaeon]|nr:hypothetical protein [Candidatus Aenigmarchaeota archaeon]